MNQKNQFDNITFESFKERAKNTSLSKYEKIGFPDAYRKGKELNIFNDIYSKLKLDRSNIKILDIGCGCSDLVDLLIDNSARKNQVLILNDSEEMLDLVETKNLVQKIPGKFPDNFDALRTYYGQIDVIILYSVLHYITVDMNPFNFIDKALELLGVGGRFLIGDIQNISKRNRFFQSETGIKFHKEYSNNDGSPVPAPIKFPDYHEKIDDGFVMAIMQRYRNLGFETYLLPQSEDLPMANRREDILIVRN